MKNFKRFTAAIAATLMAASLSVPMAMNVSAASIEITGISAEQAHTFEVYQVFTADLSTDASNSTVLSNVKWGTGVTAYDSENVTTGDLVSESIISAISGDDARNIISKFTLTTETANIKTVTSSSATVTINDLADGYYIVKDVTNLSEKDDANSAWIVQVAGSAEVAIKNSKPTVDKQIYDNNDGQVADVFDNNGWGETADHAINETFQFKLTATIHADSDLAAYDEYKLVFNDTMSKGVTFEDIVNVTITPKEGTAITVPVKAEDAHGYTKTDITVPDVTNGVQEWHLEIDDVKALAGEDFGTKELTVEVVYNAHLNEDAIAFNLSTSPIGKGVANDNTVSLSYSNSPDSTGEGTMGKTTEDTVFAFTYEVKNTKYADSPNRGKELAGAKFRLYSDSDCQYEVLLTYNANKAAYVPVSDGVTTGDEMESADATGVFNIIGLDAGTYYLKETEAPAGYNLMTEVKEIKIVAGHTEMFEDVATLNLEDSENMSNNIVNKSGSTLPSTGGMGTKLFFLGGGSMVAVAGIFLITKKRMGKNAE